MYRPVIFIVFLGLLCCRPASAQQSLQKKKQPATPVESFNVADCDAIVAYRHGFAAKINGLWGVWDTERRQLAPPAYDTVEALGEIIDAISQRRYSDDVKFGAVGRLNKSSDRWNDRSGVIFGNELLILRRGGKTGWVYLPGRLKVEPQFRHMFFLSPIDSIYPLPLAVVEDTAGRWGLCAGDGTPLITGADSATAGKNLSVAFGVMYDGILFGENIYSDLINISHRLYNARGLLTFWFGKDSVILLDPVKGRLLHVSPTFDVNQYSIDSYLRLYRPDLELAPERITLWNSSSGLGIWYDKDRTGVGRLWMKLDHECYFDEDYHFIAYSTRPEDADKLPNYPPGYWQAISSRGFIDGRKPVMRNLKWGYINPQGREVIPLKFDMAFEFRYGMARVDIRDTVPTVDTVNRRPRKYYKSKLGVIDTNGRWLITPRYYDRNNIRYISDHALWLYGEKLDSMLSPTRKFTNIPPELPGMLEKAQPVYGYAWELPPPPCWTLMEQVTAVTWDGRVLFPAHEVEQWGPFAPPTFIASVWFKGKGFTYIDTTGKVLIPFQQNIICDCWELEALAEQSSPPWFVVCPPNIIDVRQGPVLYTSRLRKPASAPEDAASLARLEGFKLIPISSTYDSLLRKTYTHNRYLYTPPGTAAPDTITPITFGNGYALFNGGRSDYLFNQDAELVWSGGRLNDMMMRNYYYWFEDDKKYWLINRILPVTVPGGFDYFDFRK